MPKGRVVVTLVCLAASLTAKTPEWDRANQLYRRTEYQQVLDLLLPVGGKDGDNLKLIGQSYFGLSEYKKATDAFEKAIELNPKSSELYRWLGDTYGKRAETSSFLTAPGYASKARQSFEKAVELDPNNREAISDLFDYYLEAPGFLGGGVEKAEGLVKRIARLDIPAGHHAQARLDTKLKQYDAAEQELRRAVDAAPKQPGRWIDLALFLAKRGRAKESDECFEQAAKLDPRYPQLMYARAEVYINQNRNLDDARKLLKQYMASSLTPDDPSREEAQALLKKADR